MYQGLNEADSSYISRQKLVQERIKNDLIFKQKIAKVVDGHAAQTFELCFSWLKKVELKQDRILICFELEGK